MQEEPATKGSTPTGIAPEWFSGSNVPETKQPQQRKPPKKHLIIVGIVLTLVLVGGGLLYAMISRAPSTCLDANDYEALNGVVLDNEAIASLTPGSTFFTDYVSFTTGSAEIDNSVDAEDHGVTLVQKLAKFYADRQIKPMRITVSASYLNTSSMVLATERIAAVRSALINAGIPEIVVTITSPMQVELDDETSIDSSDDDIETNISIASDTTCK
ncbi:MAG: hypothetical protein ABIP74_03955 [Candidatus Saccharimonas sp.]